MLLNYLLTIFVMLFFFFIIAVETQKSGVNWMNAILIVQCLIGMVQYAIEAEDILNETTLIF